MKILFIEPSQLRDDGAVFKAKRSSWLPSLTLPYLAGLTPSGIQTKIINDYIDTIDFDQDCDLVAITSMTVQAPRAYQIADQFRRRGRKVVMGGFHATFLPQEALKHCDSVVSGEAEPVWEKLLTDLERGSLERFYKADRLHDLKKLPMPRYDLIDLSVYRFPHICLQATRGCPFACEFCSITAFYNRTYRKRPIEDIVEEIQGLKANRFFIVDDNLTVDRDYAKRLLAALKPLKIKWFSQFNHTIGLDDELLDLAAQSGCEAMYVGFESLDQRNLHKSSKSMNLTQDYSRSIRNIMRKGIALEASFIIGFDRDDPSSFEAMLDFVLKEKIPIFSFFILQPMPGTRLYENLSKNNRILTTDWSRYTGVHVNFAPANFTPSSLEELYWKHYKRFFSI